MIIQPASRIILPILSTFLLIGCAVSINPIVPESAATLDPRLIGTWRNLSGSEWATVTPAGRNTYAIEITSRKGKTGRFSARLGRLSEYLVLDVWPAPRKGELPDPYSDLLISGHLFLILDIGRDELSIATLEPESLLAALRSGKVNLLYKESKNELIFQAPTEELRSALGPYLAQPGALPKREKWQHALRSNTVVPLPVDVPCFEASAWREADQLFRRDPNWVGGDGASSVYLGEGRTLWLFGDSWIDPSGKRTRSGARIISNSIAIQVGTDPSNSSMKFYWGRDANGAPTAIIPNDGNERHWFGNGVRVGNRLILFLNSVVSTETGIGFESVGWVAWMVENPDAEPPNWRMHRLSTPTNPLGVLIGFAAVMQLGNYVYAFGSEDPVKSHPIYAARWPAEDVRLGRLMSPEWWAGERLGWVSDSSSAARHPVFESGQSELTIHFDKPSERFIGVQTAGFGPADIMIRTAPLVTGPWSTPKLIYRPSEYYKPKAMVYSAKAHPHLTGGDMIVTYSTNSFDFGANLTDSLIYYPRFIRLTRCR